MNKLRIVFLVVFMGCASKKRDCIVKAEEILDKNAIRVHAVYDGNKNLVGISDSDTSSDKRGAYYISNTGKLQSYKFFQTDSAYSYNEEYDESGQIIKQEGKPIVDEKIREVNIDSALIKISLFSLHRAYKDMSVSINGGNSFYSPLEEDSLHSNIKIGSFGFNTRGLNKINVFLAIEYENECSEKHELIKDTITMIKNPHLIRAPR